MGLDPQKLQLRNVAGRGSEHRSALLVRPRMAPRSAIAWRSLAARRAPEPGPHRDEARCGEQRGTCENERGRQPRPPGRSSHGCRDRSTRATGSRRSVYLRVVRVASSVVVIASVVVGCSRAGEAPAQAVASPTPPVSAVPQHSRRARRPVRVVPADRLPAGDASTSRRDADGRGAYVDRETAGGTTAGTWRRASAPARSGSILARTGTAQCGNTTRRRCAQSRPAASLFRRLRRLWAT